MLPRRTLRRGRAAGAAITLLAALAPSLARAQTQAPTVAIWAEGPDADAARSEVAQSLGRDGQVVASDAWHEAYVRGGTSGPLSRALARPKTRAATLERVQRAAGSAGVGEVVVVTTSRTRSGKRVADAYLVAPGHDPEVLTHLPLGEPSGGLGSAVHDRIAADRPTDPRPATAIDASPHPETSPPPPESSTATPPVASSPLVDTTPAASLHPRHVIGRELFVLSIGGGAGTRHFSYHEPFTGNLRDYQLGAAPVFGVDGAFYPMADLKLPLAPDLGLVGGYAQALGLSTSSSESGAIGTQWTRWYAGGRFRVRTGSARAPVIGVTGAYGSDAFTFQGNDPSGTFPSVTYTYVRAGVDARVPIGRFALTANGAYLGVLSSGEVASRFPRASVGGVDFALEGSVDLAAGFEARLQGDYRRFFYAMNPTPGDTFVAAGALDEYWGVQAKVAYVF